MKKIIILGGGGHAKVLISALKALQREVIGILEKDKSLIGNCVAGIPVIGTDEMIGQYPPEDVELVNGVGSIGAVIARSSVFERFKNKGYKFSSVVHPSSVLAVDVQLGEGVQIMAGAIIQTGCSIGNNTIVNTGAVIDHDCVIEEHVHIAPGAVLSGGVKVGTMTHIGSGATIIQGIKIGKNCIIGAGSVVLKDVPPNSKAVGVPARIVNSEA